MRKPSYRFAAAAPRGLAWLSLLAASGGIAYAMTTALVSGVLPSAQAVAVEAPSDTTVPAVDMPSGAPKVLTITVDGPAASVDVFCATTTERAPFDHVHVSPEGTMDAYHRWCSPVRSE